MRALMILPLVALAACQMTKNDDNGSVTVEYNQDVAENAAYDAANMAEDVANDVENSAVKVGDKLQNVDVDVDVKTDGNKAVANAN